jgi:hypothetical protein
VVLLCKEREGIDVIWRLAPSTFFVPHQQITTNFVNSPVVNSPGPVEGFLALADTKRNITLAIIPTHYSRRKIEWGKKVI